jgi:glycosyltransferase involved in cell wall biosynthesis
VTQTVSAPDAVSVRAPESTGAVPGRLGPRDGRRIRVLHVITHLDNGGAQDNTLLTVAGLDRDRYTVDIASGPGVQEDRARAVADNLHILGSLRRPLLDPGAATTFAQLASLSANYDVVHTHGSKAGVLGRIAARMRRVPAVVHTVHGMPVHDLMGVAQRRVLLAAERAAARCADSVICVCDDNLREALALKIAKPEQLRVVVSGVDESGVSGGDGARLRAELGIPMDAPVVGSVTRLMEQKAPLDLVAAMRIVLEQRRDAHCIIAGEGPLYDAVVRAAHGADRIHVLGFRSDIPDIVAATDVAAYSSLWEGLGRALTETVLAGRPVVATAVNGVPDLVVDGVTGYLVPPRVPELLAQRTLDVLALPDRGQAMGAAGATRTRGKYDIPQMIAGIDATYRDCLSAKNGLVIHP